MAGNGKRVLVVEDEEGIRCVLTTTLQGAGHDGVEAQNGLEGFKGSTVIAPISSSSISPCLRSMDGRHYSGFERSRPFPS